ncbi:MAG TPA: hypothetical protein VKF37_21005 [Chloroflexota bacterium]|nr:hypothetical protein [Chloroflexota bacterium]
MEPKNPITLSDWLELREQMHAAELLLEDLQFAPAELATYWALSAELLALLQEVDEYLERRRSRGPGDDDQAIYLQLRRRLVGLLARTEEIGISPEQS